MRFSAKAALFIAAGGIAALSAPADARAGFEWRAPEAKKAQPQKPSKAGETSQDPGRLDMTPMNGASSPLLPLEGTEEQAPRPGQMAREPRTRQNTGPSRKQAGLVIPYELREGDVQRVSGFGDSLPLVIALRQIVPARYQFSFGSEIDPGQEISWEGGDPWPQTLDRIFERHNILGRIKGNVLTLASAGQAAPDGIAERSGRGEPVLAEPGDLFAEDYATREQPTSDETLQERDVSRLPATQSRGLENMDTSLERGFESARENRRSAPGGEMLEPPLEFDTSRGSSRQQEEPFVISSRIVETERARGMRDSAVFDEVRAWSASSGETLRDVLERWSFESGIQLHWKTDFDYPLQATVRTRGSFSDAVETLLDGLKEAQPRPLGRIHPNPPDGPAVLVIESRRIID